MRQLTIVAVAVVVLSLGFAAAAHADVTVKCADEKHYVFSADGGCVKRPPAPPKSAEALYQQGLDVLAKDAKRAAGLFDQSCKRKHAQSCTQLAYLYQSGRDRAVPQDTKRATALFEQACKGGDGHACRKLGNALDNDDPAIRPWFEDGCKLDDGTSCALLAFLEQTGQGGPEDQAGATALFDKAHKLLESNCKNNGEDCWVTAYLAENGLGETADQTKAMKYYKLACAQSYSDACVALAHGLEKAKADDADIDAAFMAACQYEHAESCQDIAIRIEARTPDDPQVLALAQRACDLDAQACFTLARFYEIGVGGIGQPDQARSTALWKSTCEGGVPEACTKYADRLAAGTGATADPATALQYYDAACNAEYANACVALSKALVETKTDDARAYDAAMKGCGYGSGYSCYITGFLTENNRRGTAPQDEASATRESVSWFAKGCKTGESISCNEIATMQKNGTGTAVDLASAYTNFTTACFNEDDAKATACTYVASTARTGNTVTPKDPAMAAKAGARACAYGELAECDIIERMPRDQLEPVMAELATRCTASDQTSCLVLGDLKATGSADEKRAALELFNAGCEQLKDQRACIREGTMLLNGTAGAPDIPKATHQLGELCAADVGAACRAMVVYAYGEKDYPATLSWAEKGCALDEPDSCSQVGFLNITPPAGLTWDVKKGGAMYEKACNLGSGVGCSNLSELYRYGVERAADPAKAYEMGKKSCELGQPQGCAEEAHWLALGQGTTKDVPRALQLLRDACSNDYPSASGCVELAAILEQEHQGTPDEIARVRLHGFQLTETEAATNAGYRWWLGLYYRDGVGTPKDPKKGLELLESSCAGYWPLGCLEAAKMLVAMPDQTSRDRGKSYYERACAAGVQEGCANMAGGGGGPKPIHPKGCCSGQVTSGDMTSLAGLTLVVGLLLGRRRRSRAGSSRDR